MRPSVPIFRTLTYLTLVGLFGLTLILFNRPIQWVAETSQRHLFLGSLSGINTRNFGETRSPERMNREFAKLTNLSTACDSPYILFGFEFLNPLIQSGPVEWQDGMDARRHFWKVRVPGLSSQDCQITFEIIKKANAGTLDKDELKRLINFQWQRLEPKIKAHGYFLLEIDFQVSTSSIQPTHLTLGTIRGTSLILWDGTPVEYFPELSQSSKLFHPGNTTPGIHRLSIVVNGQGFNTPGMVSPYFAGVVTADSMQRPDLRANVAVGTERREFFLYVLIFSSLLLFVFSFFQQSERALGVTLANILACIAVTEMLGLDHVQATLAESVIRTIRYFGFGTFSIYALDTLSLLIDLLSPALGYLLPKIQSFKTQQDWKKTKDVYFRFLSLAVIGAFLFAYWQSWSVNRPDKIIDQYQLMRYAVTGITIFGTALLLIGLVFGLARIRSREDEEAFALGEAFATAVASASVFLLFSVTHQQTLNRWIKFSLGANTSQVLQVATVPILAASSILFLMIFAFRRQALYRRVLPEATTELLKQSRYGQVDPDRTASEFNWILLNDVVGSSPLKLTTLEILSHMLQSVFHKIHKTYLKDSIRFLNSLGDALLITIKTPARSRNQDPILEKLVRCYALHLDGAKALRDSDRVLAALLALREKELHLAIGEQARRRERLQVSVENLRFRTLLTANYYFYGVNYEISNIDSRHVYVLSKAEKQVDTGKQGGFIVFPDLMRILKIAVPRMDEFFEAVKIETSSMHPAIAAAVPEVAYRLRESGRAEFEKHLETIYGGPLFLRASPESGDPYGVAGGEVARFCERIGSLKDTREILATLERELPPLKNFAEKDQLIVTVSEALCAADFWMEKPGQDKLRERVWSFLTGQVGIPTQRLIEAIGEKDALLAPESLLSDLRSIDAVRRNRAMRSLPLARTRNPFRPQAMGREDFARQVLYAYLERFEAFSVESHIGLWAAMSREDGHLELARELAAGAGMDAIRMRELLAFLDSHSASSLRSLATWIRAELNRDGVTLVGDGPKEAA